MFPITDDSTIVINSGAEEVTELGRNLQFDYASKSFVLVDGAVADNVSDLDKVKQYANIS